MSGNSKDKGEKKKLKKDQDVSDYSLLRPSIELGISGVQQIVNCMSIATCEVKELLQNECDVIFECKVCRNLFRALPNFMAHKRVYCRDVHRFVRALYPSPSEVTEQVVVLQPETPGDLQGVSSTNGVVSESAAISNEGSSQSLKSTLDAALHKLELQKRDSTLQTQLTLSAIEGNGNAVFQSVNNRYTNGHTDSDDGGSRDSRPGCHDKTDVEEDKSVCIVNPEAGDGYVRMNLRQRGKKDQDESSETSEKNERVTKRKRDERRENGDDVKDGEGHPMRKSRRFQTVTVQIDGDSPGKIHVDGSGSAPSPPALRILRQHDKMSLKEQLRTVSDCDVSALKCRKCNVQYSSVKMLHSHMMSSHSVKQPFYPCIYCSSVFAQLWGVMRHLQRTHRKTKEQAERLTETLKKRCVYKSAGEVGEYHSPCKVKEEVTPVPADIVNKNQECKVILTQQNVIKGKKTKQRKQLSPEPVKVSRRSGNVKKTQFELFKCKECNKVFGKQSALEKHVKTCVKVKRQVKEQTVGRLSGHTPVRVFSCNRCEKLFVKEETLKRHFEDCCPPVKVKAAPTPALLVANEAAKQGANESLAGVEQFSCQQCNKVFVKKENLTRHMELCNAPKLRVKTTLKAGDDGSGRRPRRLIRVKRHDDGEIYQRPGEVQGSDKFSADVIKAKELKNKRVERESCLAGFSEQDLRQIDGMVNMDTLVCLRCKRQYGSISNLRRHAVRHLGWKRFKCRLCSFTSYNKSECRSHLRKIHSSKLHREADPVKYIIDLDGEADGGMTFDSSDQVGPGVNVINIDKVKLGRSEHTRSTRSNPHVSPEKTKSRGQVDGMQVLSTRSGVYLKQAIKKGEPSEDEVAKQAEVCVPKSDVKSPVRADRGNVFENVGFMRKCDQAAGSSNVANALASVDSPSNQVTNQQVNATMTTDLPKNTNNGQKTSDVLDFKHQVLMSYDESPGTETKDPPGRERVDQCCFDEKMQVLSCLNKAEGEANKVSPPVLDMVRAVSGGTSGQQSEVQTDCSVAQDIDDHPPNIVDDEFSVAKIALQSTGNSMLACGDSVVIRLDPSMSDNSFTHTAQIMYPDMPDDIMDTEGTEQSSEGANEVSLDEPHNELLGVIESVTETTNEIQATVSEPANNLQVTSESLAVPPTKEDCAESSFERSDLNDFKNDPVSNVLDINVNSQSNDVLSMIDFSS